MANEPEQSDPPSVEDIGETAPDKPSEESKTLAQEFGQTSKRDYDRELQDEKLKQQQQDRQGRGKFTCTIFILICCWLAGLITILLFQGWEFCGFKLSNAVLITFIGGTTGNVIGLLFIVLRYLFPKG